ncbi:hypothetical protein LZ198_29120 [Myxococcus sp. K15C18031901]|uniref:hypothetical protein n=1 Tax=Myxococcus dinghuensis TaxID=2906761 RepID=UPI0020A80754|nr:hypothetical protein [Myxococcus dinghuensis]MCP3102947.1 hypothetical protein [Myxococcus dinghuensis]
MQTPLLASVRTALDRAITALEQAGTPELVLATPDELRQVDSPFTAAFVLCALACEPARLEPAARPFLRYLQDTRDAAGRWPLWESPSDDAPASVSTCARAHLALGRWGVAPAPPPEALARLLEAVRPTRSGDALETLARVDVLALATRHGERPGDLAALVGQGLETGGLEALPDGAWRVSPFAHAHALSLWLDADEDLLGLRRIVWRDGHRLRLDALENALDCALLLTTLLTLGPARGEPTWEERVDELAQYLLEQQSELGLWPALPLFTDASGRVHGSLQVSTAACIEALTRFSRWKTAALSPEATREAPPPPPRGWRAAAGRKPRSADIPPRPGTWGTTLDALRGLVPAPLTAPEALADVRAIAAWLPSELTNGFGLETRLTDPAARADVFFWLNADSLGPDIVAGRDPHIALPERLSREPLWRSITTFARQWVDPGSLLHQGVDSFWLEFDVAGPPPEPPAPVVFFCPEEMPLPHDTATGHQARRRHQDIATAALSTLSDGALADETLRNVRACIDALPAGSQPFALGILRSRQLDTVRFCAKDIPVHGMRDYLAAVGWEGPREDFDALLDWLGPLADRFVLDFDVGSRVLPTVGLEVSFHHRRQPPTEPRWSPLLDALVARGLCRPDKREALLAWPGQVPCTEDFGHEVREGRFDKRLSHLKLSLKPQLEAKAYFGAWRYTEARRTT